MADALQDELLAVPGIAGAEVESDSGVAGVRVQLAIGADAEEVGAAVRRILAHHGMRPASETTDEESGRPPPPPGAPGSVVSFPLIGEHAAPDGQVEMRVAEGQLESVAIEETPEGISVSVGSTDGRRITHSLQRGWAEMEEAIVAAVGELTGTAGVAVAGVNEARFGDHAVITVLLERAEGDFVSGAAIQRGGRAYAVARAAWLALRGGADLTGR